MKRLYILAAAALALFSCIAKTEDDTVSKATDYFDAWLKINYPEAREHGMGVYVIEDTPGTGPYWDSTYIFTTYTATSLDGTVSYTGKEDVAKQIGTYKSSNYYGPVVLTTGESLCYAGIEAILGGEGTAGKLPKMRVGGTRKAVIPSWLMTYSRYTSADKYKENIGNNTAASAIYTITLEEQTDDIIRLQCDITEDRGPIGIFQLQKFIDEKMGGIDSMYVAGNDSLQKRGFYFQSLKKPSEIEIPSDSTVYVNYIGRLLDGRVFDTTIADTAKFYGIWNSSRTYEPLPVVKNGTCTKLTLDGSTTVTGFAGGIYLMHENEKARVAFSSDLGYGSSSKGIVPAYAPLVFDLELTNAPE